MNANTFCISFSFNLCFFLYVKALPLDNFWKHRTLNPLMQNGNPPGSACHFPTEHRLPKEVSTPCHFHSSFAASQAAALPINPSNSQPVDFQKWNSGKKNTTSDISRNSELVNVCIVATYREVLTSLYFKVAHCIVIVF